MKKTILISGLVILLSLFAFSCNGSSSDKHNHDEMSMNDDMNKNETTTSDAVKTITKTFQVNGACNMCKDRIETAALSVEGVEKADWSIDEKILTLTYDEGLDVSKVLRKIADVGHDNEMFTADDDVYDALPGCCHYR